MALRSEPGWKEGGREGECLKDAQWAGGCLLAVMLLDFEVRVEVEDNLLVGFGRVNNPLAVLVGRVVLGVTWRGDVASIFGIQTTATGWV